MIEKNIGIIGVGKMGKAFVKGLLDNQLVERKRLFLSNCASNNQKVAKSSDVIILAVKPDVVKKVCRDIREVINLNSFIISIAAGIEIKSIKRWLKNKHQPIARIMPNTPLQIAQGMSGWTAGEEVNQHQKSVVETILKTLGKEIYFENETELDKVTAISGSGPAYFYYYVESLLMAAKKIGLDCQKSKRLVYQTAVGSLELLLQSGLEPSALRGAVTSKGGTTEVAIQSFEDDQLTNIISKGVQAAFNRSRELANKYD